MACSYKTELEEISQHGLALSQLWEEVSCQKAVGSPQGWHTWVHLETVSAHSREVARVDEHFSLKTWLNGWT